LAFTLVDETPCGCLLPRSKEIARSIRKLIITVALTGGQYNKHVNPSLLEQPDGIAEAAYQSFNEGAAIVHIHARDKNGMPTGDARMILSLSPIF
jgi:uncharacterized protein (DUF849 family)